MPLRDYQCLYCGHEFEEIVRSQDPDDYKYAECRCGSKAEVLPALIGGYSGAMGGASTRPKNSTSMARGKVFTRHPGNQGEPTEVIDHVKRHQEEGKDYE